jgi:hypothetical protein
VPWEFRTLFEIKLQKHKGLMLTETCREYGAPSIDNLAWGPCMALTEEAKGRLPDVVTALEQTIAGWKTVKRFGLHSVGPDPEDWWSTEFYTAAIDILTSANTFTANLEDFEGLLCQIQKVTNLLLFDRTSYGILS